MKRLLIALLVAVGLLTVGASSAAAAVPSATVAAVPAIPGVPDCKGDPQLSSPLMSPGNIDPGPAAPRDGDPFAKDAKVSAYEVYGWAGLNWPNYDLGCGPDVAQDPGSSGAGIISNAMWGLLVTSCAATVSVIRFAFDPNTVGVFDPIQKLGAEVFGNRLFMLLFWITLAATGLLILTKSGKGDVKGAVHNAGWVTMVMVAAMALTLWPTVIAPKVDQAVTGIVATTSSAVAGGQSTSIADAVGANLQRGLLFETWKQGMFGRDSGPVVDKYAPELFKAAAITRTQAAKAEKDLEYNKKLYAEKSARYKAVAKKIQAADPRAYSYMAGHQNNARITFAATAWIGFWCIALFLIVASIIVLFGLVVVRVVGMIFPGVALIGGFPKFQRLVLHLFDYTLGALAAAVTFGSFAMVFAYAVGAFMSPSNHVNPILSMLLLLVLTGVCWKVTKPFRTIKTFINVRPAMDRFRRQETTDAKPSQPGQQSPADTAGAQPGTTGAPSQYAGARPAEARTRTVIGGTMKSAATGAVQGAMASVAAGVVTGGGATLAAAGAGAARGAAVAGAGAAASGLTGSPTAGAVAATAAGRGITGHDRHALATEPAAAPLASAPTEATRTRFIEDTPNEAPMRLYHPGEVTPVDNLPAAPATHDGAYDIYTSNGARV